jgi:hypothetical protein
MEEAAKMRIARIERLLSELEYEIARGVMEREIEPDIHMSRIFPCIGRGDGTARLDVHVYPGSPHMGSSGMRRQSPKLRTVKDGEAP